MPSRRRFDDAAVESALRDLAAHTPYPPTPHLAARVRARIVAREPAPRRPWIFALAPAVVTLLVLAAGAAAVETVRLRGIDVFRGPAITAPPLRPLDLGTRVSLEDARRAGATVPGDPVLSRPDEVYLAATPSTVRVYFAYRPRAGLPAGPTGYGALVGQFAGVLEPTLLGKVAGAGTRVEQLDVNGGPGVWLEGETHFFFYRDRSGDIVQESLRLAGNTLLWEQNGVLYRIEAQLTKAEALRLAASFR